MSRADPSAMRAQLPRRRPRRGTTWPPTHASSSPAGSPTPWTAGCTEPNAMVVSTADADGRPSSRTVLLKGYDERGFVFFTNYASRKGRELDRQPVRLAALPLAPAGPPGDRRRRGRPGSAGRRRSPTSAPVRTAPSSAPGRASSPRRSPHGRNCNSATTELASRYPEGRDGARAARSGAASAWRRTRWSSGRAARTACTTGSYTSARPRAGRWRVCARNGWWGWCGWGFWGPGDRGGCPCAGRLVAGRAVPRAPVGPHSCAGVGPGTGHRRRRRPAGCHPEFPPDTGRTHPASPRVG